MVGYYNTAFAEVFRPALTVLAQPIEELGELAVDFIMSMINTAEQDEQLTPVEPVEGMLPPAAVKEAVEEQGYRTNDKARGLRLRSTAVDGQLVQDDSTPVIGQLARVQEEADNKRG